MESNPGPQKVAKATNGEAKSKGGAKVEMMVNLNGHVDVADQVEVRSVLERQAELIGKQKDDIVELRKRLEDNVR